MNTMDEKEVMRLRLSTENPDSDTGEIITSLLSNALSFLLQPRGGVSLQHRAIEF